MKYSINVDEQDFFLSYSGSLVRQATRALSRKIVFHCWIQLSIYRYTSQYFECIAY